MLGESATIGPPVTVSVLMAAGLLVVSVKVIMYVPVVTGLRTVK
jgi:hypothetical protein